MRISDWSSDVCSSDLGDDVVSARVFVGVEPVRVGVCTPFVDAGPLARLGRNLSRCLRGSFRGLLGAPRFGVVNEAHRPLGRGIAGEERVDADLPGEVDGGWDVSATLNAPFNHDAPTSAKRTSHL